MMLMFYICQIYILILAIFLRFYFPLLADLKVTKIITVIYHIVLSKNKLSLKTENTTFEISKF